MEPSAIKLQDVWLSYRIYGTSNRSLKQTVLSRVSRGRIGGQAGSATRVQALKGISLDLQEGDRVGLIGSNGAGKTTLLRVLVGAMWPDRGYVRRVGMTSSLFDVFLGMNFELSGWENIILRGLFLGLGVPEIRAHLDEIVAFCGLTTEQLSRPVRTYSAGMGLRLAFAVCTCLNPDILLLDEWIWVSDASFVQKAQDRMNEMVQQTRIMVIATHAESLIRTMCNKALYLRHGEMRFFGPVDEAFAAYNSDVAAAA